MRTNDYTRRQFAQLAGSAAALAAGGLASFSARAQQVAVEPEPVDPLAGSSQGPWRRLFLDAAAMEAQEGLTRVFHAAEKFQGNPVIVADKPWEAVSAITGPYAYGTTIWEGDKLRLWYQVLNEGNHVCYAESRDGLVWTKPELNVIEFNGSKANNLVVSVFQPKVTGGICHNPSVVRRPNEGDPQRRYALYGYDPAVGPRVAFSPDGLHWQYDPATAKQPLFSSSDVVNFFHDPYQGRYAATWKTRNRRGRAVGVAWSEDGLAWSKPFDGPVFVADDLDPDATQIYGMPAFAYQGLYVGLPWLYRARYFKYGDYSVKKLHDAQAESPRTMEVQIAWSWDLVNWSRTPARDQFIPRGDEGQWDDGMIVTARAPVIVGDKLHFYYGGCDGLHDDKRVKAAIGLATLRLDGFCSMSAGDTEGWLVSRREPFRTPEVVINAQTAANGFVVAEILDRRNRVLPGFSRQDCLPFTGDSVRHSLKWSSNEFPPSPKADDWRIRFWLKNAKLYSYLPAGLDPAQPDIARIQQAGP